MSRKQFTEDQQQKLRQNPYVYSVTATRLSLTREFKELFMEACRAGETPRKILEDHGFSVELIGERHTRGIQKARGIPRGLQQPQQRRECPGRPSVRR